LHVVLHWAHFSTRPEEILRFHSGGLDWHGAVIGALIGLSVVTRWRGLSLPRLLDAFTLGLPLLALTGWLGCWAAGCGYGTEVETLAYYPGWMVSIAPDVYGIPAPRYNTQFFGTLAALVLLLLAAGLIWQGWLAGRRFWLILALLSLSVFAIGFFRADYALVIAGLRADQWLDLSMLGFAVVSAWVLRHET
jgi:phosphatidylglycerol:prolipoprotein diacylglycerol transferase